MKSSDESLKFINEEEFVSHFRASNLNLDRTFDEEDFIENDYLRKSHHEENDMAISNITKSLSQVEISSENADLIVMDCSIEDFLTNFNSKIYFIKLNIC